MKLVEYIKVLNEAREAARSLPSNIHSDYKDKYLRLEDNPNIKLEGREFLELVQSVKDAYLTSDTSELATPLTYLYAVDYIMMAKLGSEVHPTYYQEYKNYTSKMLDAWKEGFSTNSPDKREIAAKKEREAFCSWLQNYVPELAEMETVTVAAIEPEEDTSLIDLWD